MRRPLLTVWYVVMMLSALELATYGLTGYVSHVYHSLVLNQFNENCQLLQDVDQQVPYGEKINRYASDAGINPQLVAAVIQAESSFNSRSVSSAGAYGLMQITPDTWREINQKFQVCAGRHRGECGSECYFNADLNLHIGTIYLSQLLKRYEGNMILALAAYNAGPGAVDGYGGVPPYAETVQYTEKIVDLFYKLQDEKKVYFLISRLEQWEKVHKSIGWCLVITVVAGVWIICRLVRSQSSWYWR